ncbi:hypothetical protein [Nocardioides jensenii]|uniref:hypothetical protein n=1 Tax=Nocardioides jensenii TaxID=1843 RepID=UPI00082B1D75|nr:hypothetical protein [Nocardioides jensenii]
MSKSNHVLMISPDDKPWKCPVGYVKHAQAKGFRLADEESAEEHTDDDGTSVVGFDGFNGDDFTS